MLFRSLSAREIVKVFGSAHPDGWTDTEWVDLLGRLYQLPGMQDVPAEAITAEANRFRAVAAEERARLKREKEQQEADERRREEERQLREQEERRRQEEEVQRQEEQRQLREQEERQRQAEALRRQDQEERQRLDQLFVAAYGEAKLAVPATTPPGVLSSLMGNQRSESAADQLQHVVAKLP